MKEENFKNNQANLLLILKWAAWGFGRRTRYSWTISSCPNKYPILLRTNPTNPLPDMPILGSFNLTVNRYMMSKIWTNGDTVNLIELNTWWEKKKLLVTSNFSFSHNVFKSCLFLMHQNQYRWSKGLCKTLFL